MESNIISFVCMIVICMLALSPEYSCDTHSDRPIIVRVLFHQAECADGIPIKLVKWRVDTGERNIIIVRMVRMLEWLEGG